MSQPAFLSARPDIPVADVAGSVAFYQAALGFEVRMQAEGYDLAVVGLGGVEVALVGSGARTVRGPAGAYLMVEGVDALHEQAAAAPGGRIAYPLTDEPWGLRNFVLEDPDANRIAIGERIAGA